MESGVRAVPGGIYLIGRGFAGGEFGGLFGVDDAGHFLELNEGEIGIPVASGAIEGGRGFGSAAHQFGKRPPDNWGKA